jgi:hypothetical protein
MTEWLKSHLDSLTAPISAPLLKCVPSPLKNSPYMFKAYGAGRIKGTAYGANIIGADLRHFYGIKRRIILMVARGK